MTSPVAQPSLFDFFTLDYTRHPGVSYISSGGERVLEFQDQGVPMTTGATTVFRMEPNGEISYDIHLWSDEDPNHFAEWEAYAAMLIDGKNQRPPRVYTLADVRLEDTQMVSVSLKSLGPRMVKRGGPAVHKVTFKEVRKQKPWGGTATKTALDPEVEKASADAAAARSSYEAAKKAARAGK